MEKQKITIGYLTNLSLEELENLKEMVEHVMHGKMLSQPSKKSKPTKAISEMDLDDEDGRLITI